MVWFFIRWTEMKFGGMPRYRKEKITRKQVGTIIVYSHIIYIFIYFIAVMKIRFINHVNW